MNIFAARTNNIIMSLNQRIQAFTILGKFLSQFSSENNKPDTTLPFMDSYFDLMKDKRFLDLN